MRCLFLFFLLLTNVHWAADMKPEGEGLREELRALKGFQKFDVTTFILSYDEANESKIYDSVVDAFRKLGQTSVSGSGSLIADFVRGAAVFPSCQFWVEKKEGGVEISLEVLAEAEVLANKHRTICPVWEKTLYSAVPSDDRQADLAIATLAQGMIKQFGEDWKKANCSEPKTLSFHVRKFESL
jgi:hypothetical protein